MSDEPKKTEKGTGKSGARKHGRGKSNRRNVSGTFGKGAYVERSSERHQGRILAMQTLFEVDSSDHEIDDVIARMQFDEIALPESAQESPDQDELAIDDVSTGVAKHAESLARGTVANLLDIDPMIEKAAPAFPIDQIAAVDRNVLRLAIYELFYHPEVPVGVAINEAVEIAKRFGGPNSGRFVNGVLGTISKQLPEERLMR